MDWANSLPLDVMELVARGRDDLKAMRGVCQSWKVAYDNTVTGIRVVWSGLLEISASSLFDRYPNLTSLDLGDCLMGDEGMAGIQCFARLENLNLGGAGQGQLPTQLMRLQVGFAL